MRPPASISSLTVGRLCTFFFLARTRQMLTRTYVFYQLPATRFLPLPPVAPKKNRFVLTVAKHLQRTYVLRHCRGVKAFTKQTSASKHPKKWPEFARKAPRTAPPAGGSAGLQSRPACSQNRRGDGRDPESCPSGPRGAPGPRRTARGTPGNYQLVGHERDTRIKETDAKS